MLICTQQSTFNLLPTTTIRDIKEYIREKGQDPTTAQLKLGDGTLISPIVFQSNTYDAITFKQYKDKLKGSVLIVNSDKKVPNIEKTIKADPDLTAMFEEVTNDYMFGPMAKMLFAGIL